MSLKQTIVAAFVAIVAISANTGVCAQQKTSVIASFSILGDLVKNVGGDRVEVGTLVGPNSDSHVYSPAPADAKRVAAAKAVFINGLGLEGWITRLVKASGTKAATVTATHGIKTRRM